MSTGYRDTLTALDAKLQRRIERAPLPPAVVVGTGITGLTLARAVSRHGAPVLGIDWQRRRYTSYSGAFNLVLVDRDVFLGAELVEFLEQLARRIPERAALLLSMDEHVKLVADHGRRLKDRYCFEFPEPDTVDLLMNKQRFSGFAREQGWPIPRTFSCRSREEMQEAAGQLTYPVVLKPHVKNLDFRINSPKKAFRCANPDELLKCYGLFARWEPEAIVQEWIPGGDNQVCFSFHYFDAALREVSSFQGRKIRQWHPEVGSTSSAIGLEEDGIGSLSREILTTTGCVGFGAVEYKRDVRNGAYYITEPTVGRVNLQVGVALANGVDLISRAYFHLVDRSYPEEGHEPTWDRKWIILKSDLKSARYYIKNSDLTWREYLRSLRGPRRFAVWRWDDYRMMLGFCGVTLTRAARLLRRLFSAARELPAHTRKQVSLSRDGGHSEDG